MYCARQHLGGNHCKVFDLAMDPIWDSKGRVGGGYAKFHIH